MQLRDTIEIIINIVLYIGFIILIFGVGLWIFNFSKSIYLSTEAMLVIFGCIFLIFGTFAAKIFSKV